MKTVVLVMIFAGCLMLGRIKACRCGERTRLLTDLCAFLRLARDSIAYACLSPDEILRSAARRQDLKQAAFLQTIDPSAVASEGFSRPWSETLSPLPLKEEERGLLLSWGETLGKSDRESQLLSCDGVLCRLTELKNDALRDTEKQSRMWLSLGAIGGAFAVVMLI